MLAHAVFFMSLALLFYTYAVFSGRKEGLHLKHLVVFGTGLIFDYLGTGQMNIYASLHGKAPQLHNLTGLVSLAGMGFHFILALLATILRKADRVNLTFHRVSVTIYSLWLIAFATGAAYGMRHLSVIH